MITLYDLTHSSEWDSVVCSFKEHDVFNREPFGKGILQLINQETNHCGALTISIDAPWGIGKTTFMKMLERLIKDKTFGWWTVYYDAWENDMTNDPFTSLLFQICGQCGRQATTADQKDAVKEYVKKISEAAAGILDMIPDYAFNGKPRDFLGQEHSSEDVEIAGGYADS